MRSCFAVSQRFRPSEVLETTTGIQLNPTGIVFEDAPSGIRAGLAAGCRVLGVCTSHRREQLEGLAPTWLVNDLSKWVLLRCSRDWLLMIRVKAKLVDGGVELEIDESH